VGRYREKKFGVFNRNLLGIFRIGTLFWTIRILAGIYWHFGEWGFWRVERKFWSIFEVKLVCFLWLFLVDFQNKKTEYFLVSMCVNYPYMIGKKIGGFWVLCLPGMP